MAAVSRIVLKENDQVEFTIAGVKRSTKIQNITRFKNVFMIDDSEITRLPIYVIPDNEQVRLDLINRVVSVS